MLSTEKVIRVTIGNAVAFIGGTALLWSLTSWQLALTIACFAYYMKKKGS